MSVAQILGMDEQSRISGLSFAVSLIFYYHVVQKIVSQLNILVYDQLIGRQYCSA